MRISTDEARTIRTRHNSIENRFNTIQEEVLRLEKKIDKLATGGLGFFGRLFANAKQIEKSEAIHIKKNPNASTKFGSPYVIKYGDEVDYFS